MFSFLTHYHLKLLANLTVVGAIGITQLHRIARKVKKGMLSQVMAKLLLFFDNGKVLSTHNVTVVK